MNNTPKTTYELYKQRDAILTSQASFQVKQQALKEIEQKLFPTKLDDTVLV